MAASVFLNQDEKCLVEELDRFVAGATQAMGHKPPEIVLSKRQANTLRRIVEKVKNKPGLCLAPNFDRDKNTYCGIPLVSQEKLRRYRQRKDMAAFNFEKTV